MRYKYRFCKLNNDGHTPYRFNLIIFSDEKSCFLYYPFSGMIFSWMASSIQSGLGKKPFPRPEK